MKDLWGFLAGVAMFIAIMLIGAEFRKVHETLGRIEGILQLERVTP